MKKIIIFAIAIAAILSYFRWVDSHDRPITLDSCVEYWEQRTESWTEKPDYDTIVNEFCGIYNK